jgi:hypothetical protein
MTHSIQEKWIAAAPGREINPDNAYGLQCVDVADDYAEFIFGLPWQRTIGGVVGANGFAGLTNDYFTWHPNVPGDLTSVPERGDLVIFGGSPINPYGHVAVVLSADAYSMAVIQQDGYLQTPAHISTLPYDGPGTGPCTGWLRPNIDPEVPAASHAPDPAAGQRVVGSQGVTERSSAAVRDDNKTGRVFNPGDTLNFKGFVTGATANGTNVWFVGAFSGTFFSASAFDDQSTTGLPDLTPAKPTAPPTLSATQRIVGAAGATKRDAPNAGSAALETFAPGDVLNLVGWTRGVRPYGLSSSDVWLVGTSGKFIWSGGVVGGDKLDGLPEIVLGAPATPGTPAVPAPAPIPAYSFAKRWKSVTDVAPAHVSNFMRGNFPARPEFFVVHQMDDPDKHPTLDGTIGWFQTERRNPSSAHFGAQGKRLTAIVDTVDRAYHAGTVGNNYLSCEVPPNPDAETVATVKTFLREWRDTQGYELKLTTHRVIPGNNTTCGAYIDLALFDISGETPAAPAPVVPSESDVEDFVAFLVNLWKASK